MGANLGWKTVRKTWESYLCNDKDFTFKFYHPEEYAGKVTHITRKLKRFISFGSALGGSRAAQQAISEGFTTIVVSPPHFSGLLPFTNGVKYYVYGDATIRQIDALGYTLHKQGTSSIKGLIQYPLRAIYYTIYDRAVDRLSRGGHVFLCSSEWYANGLMDEHNVPSNQIEILPIGVDTGYWKPPQDDTQSESLSSRKIKVIFIGGDFHRKGGDVLLNVSKMDNFRDCEFHFVTRAQAPQDAPSNAIFYNQMTPNSNELRDLVSSCDIFVLPTQADCSPVSVLEAASSGLPVVVSNVGGIPEIVDDNETGIVLESISSSTIAEAISTYKNNRNRLTSQKISARKKALREFDHSVLFGKLKGILSTASKYQ